MLREEIFDIETTSGSMAVLRKRPTGTDASKVVIFHDGPGIRSATHEYCRELAGLGYDVIVPDLYHRRGRLIGFEPEEIAADNTIVDRLWGMIDSMTDDEIQSDLDDVMAAVDVAESEQLGCIGFCLGARAVFRTMLRKPDQFPVGSMSHPSFLVDDADDSPHRLVGRFTGKLFVGIGDADQVQSIETQQGFFDAVANIDRIDVEYFAGVDHAYTWPRRDTYNAEAAEVCFAATTTLLAESLGYGLQP